MHSRLFMQHFSALQQKKCANGIRKGSYSLYPIPNICHNLIFLIFYSLLMPWSHLICGNIMVFYGMLSKRWSYFRNLLKVPLTYVRTYVPTFQRIHPYVYTYVHTYISKYVRIWKIIFECIRTVRSLREVRTART